MSLNVELFVLFLNLFHDFVRDLISNVLHVGSTFAGADAVDKADLLELAITQTTDNFPPV